jgi:hypothetical protein
LRGKSKKETPGSNYSLLWEKQGRNDHHSIKLQFAVLIEQERNSTMVKARKKHLHGSVTFFCDHNLIISKNKLL